MKSLLEKIKSISHLPIDFQFDASKIEREIRELPFPLMQYNANKQSEHAYSDSGWNNLALFSESGSIFCDCNEASGGEKFLSSFGKFQKTGLSEYMPYTYEILESLSAGKSMARIEEVHPNTIIGWHSHVLEFSQPEDILIVQLPIVIPEEFKYSVIDYVEYRSFDFSKDKIKQYDFKYTVGIPYIFNSYHYHNVFNFGSNPALMIRFFVKLEDIEELVERSLEQYSGDLIVGCLNNK